MIIYYLETEKVATKSFFLFYNLLISYQCGQYVQLRSGLVYMQVALDIECRRRKFFVILNNIIYGETLYLKVLSESFFLKQERKRFVLYESV